MHSLAPSNPSHLLHKARAGDEAALGQLLGLYRDYLKLLARMQINRRLQRKLDASDAVQEACLRAARYFGQFRGQTEPELLAWLRQILAACLANMARQFHGTKQRQIALEQELHQELDDASHALDKRLIQHTTPSAALARREQGVLLANALAALPRDYREAVVLRHLEGLSFPEIALRMDRSLDSVKKLWARALARLRVASDSLTREAADE